jgi:hypothetical protein
VPSLPGGVKGAKLPVDARLVPKPELSTAKADVYRVSLQNVPPPLDIESCLV